jgi:hypothetical protein
MEVVAHPDRSVDPLGAVLRLRDGHHDCLRPTDHGCHDCHDNPDVYQRLCMLLLPKDGRRGEETGGGARGRDEYRTHLYDHHDPTEKAHLGLDRRG